MREIGTELLLVLYKKKMTTAVNFVLIGRTVISRINHPDTSFAGNNGSFVVVFKGCSLFH